MICLLSGPDLFVNYIIFSKPTILQVRFRDPMSILRNLCPWHSALFAVVLFDCSNRYPKSCWCSSLLSGPIKWTSYVCNLYSNSNSIAATIWFAICFFSRYVLFVIYFLRKIPLYLPCMTQWLSISSGIPPNPPFDFQFVWFLFLFSAESQGPPRLSASEIGMK
jgi:hypothetical protein